MIENMADEPGFQSFCGWKSATERKGARTRRSTAYAAVKERDARTCRARSDLGEKNPAVSFAFSCFQVYLRNQGVLPRLLKSFFFLGACWNLTDAYFTRHNHPRLQWYSSKLHRSYFAYVA